MKLLKKDIQHIDVNGMVMGGEITMFVYYSTNSAVWTFIRDTLRLPVSQIVTRQTKRRLTGEDTPL